MILDVDGGNTRLKWRLSASDAVVERGAGTLDTLLEALSGHGSPPELIRVASVASERQKKDLSQALEAATGTSPGFAVSRLHWQGLKSAYANPAQMGVDRWLAMMAGWARCRQGFAVVDAGSALTIDFVVDDGRHVGGYILPGWRMLLESLSRGTAQVRPEPEDAGWAASPGTDTSSCVNQGVAWLWESWVARLKMDCSTLGLKTCFLTGGDAGRAQFAGLSASIWPEMVLDGLSLLPGDDLASPVRV